MSGKNINAISCSAKTTYFITGWNHLYYVQKIPSLQATVRHLTHVHDHLSLPMNLEQI